MRISFFMLFTVSTLVCQSQKITESSISIHCLGNNLVSTKADVTMYVSDENGTAKCNGDYLTIKNNGKQPFYYRSDNKAVYRDSKSDTLETTVGHVFEWEEVPPGQSRTILIAIYKTQKERQKKVLVHLNVKYSEPNDPKNTTAKKPATTEKEKVSKNEVPGKKYFFLTASITLPRKTYTFLSGPLAYDGNRKADFLKQKQAFLAAMETAFINELKSEDFLHPLDLDITTIASGGKNKTELSSKEVEKRKESLKNSLEENSYQAITPLFGKPWSNQSLLSISECDQAITEYKNMTLKTLEGIATPEFIHIR